MPILDSSDFADNHSLPDFMRCDVCIVGTGPAGMTIARELSGGSLKVTILESGGMTRQVETDALNEAESVGWPRVEDQWLVRNRAVGGTSNTWTGRCAPFDAIDLQFRDWVPGSGWPVTADELIPYLDRSAKYLDLTVGSGYSEGYFWARHGGGRTNLHADPDELLPFFWQNSYDPVICSPANFGTGLDDTLGPNVTLVTNATVLRVNAAPSGASVESVEFADSRGRRWVLPTSTVVLCAGGIENARLLLSSDNVMTRGLGNDRDLVGRYLMDHPRTTVGSFHIDNAKGVVSRFGQFKWRSPDDKRKRPGSIFQPGLRLSPAIQRSEQLLNGAIWVREIRSPGNPVQSLIRLPRNGARIRDYMRTALTKADFAAFDLKEQLIVRRDWPSMLDGLNLDAICEQRPNHESRVTLSDRRDHFGMRIPRIDWRVSEDEARTLRRITQLTIEALPRMGLDCPLTLADWVRDGAMFPQTIRDAAHPIGTTRMADDPAKGVVDAQCRVHGVAGLFIGGSSVFTTSAHANPTQMIVTLAIRLADTLKASADAGNTVSLTSAVQDAAVA